VNRSLKTLSFIGIQVKFLRPSESEGRDKFYNILVLHQNRAEGRGRKNAIFESMIPEWFDVVVWGHEHECQVRFMIGSGVV
jgi:double-strand break repair protein MRE11